MSKKALVVGIDHYAHVSCLHGCVADATAVDAVLRRNGDKTKNFDVNLMTASGARKSIGRKALKQAIEELFKGKPEIALLYFAGHGHIEDTGGYLLTSECDSGDDGVPLGEVLTMANKSHAGHRLIVLDSCHSGIAGNHPDREDVAELRTGTTILAASTAQQYATEENGRGLFTSLMVNALEGEAADLLGRITPAGVYALIDRSLGSWQQRPVLKAHVDSFAVVRTVAPSVTEEDLRLLPKCFPKPGAIFPLDPSFEPDSERDTGRKPSPRNMKTFAALQRLNRVNLVLPEGASKPHMYYAAMESKGCRLTSLGEHYRRLAAADRI